MALSDQQQAMVTLVSLILIAIGAIIPPPGISPAMQLLLIIAGVLGMTIKEWLGTAPVTTPVPIPAPVPPVTPTNPVFDVNLAKAAGFKVYANSAYPQGYVLQGGGDVYDVTGKPIGTQVPAGSTQV